MGIEKMGVVMKNAAAIILVWTCLCPLAFGQEPDSFKWKAIYEDGVITMTGYVPSEDGRIQAITAAKAKFPNRQILDEMTVSGEAPARYLDAINFAMAQLSQLDVGSVELNNLDFTIRGVPAENEESGWAKVYSQITGDAPDSVSVARIDFMARDSFFYDEFLLSSRIFSGPNHYPPTGFKAYAILAFPSAASSANRARHIRFCEAYTGAIVHSFYMDDKPRSEQIVTVWPISTDKTANEINSAARSSVCDRAVDEYGLQMSQSVLAKAGKRAEAEQDFSGRGPYLLAWAPASKITTGNAELIVIDLSDRESPISIKEFFETWKTKIESERSVWANGWDDRSVTNYIRDFLNDSSAKIATLIGGG